jgi:hypothetical protein
MEPQAVEPEVHAGTPTGEPAPAPSFVRRIFGRHLMDMSVLLLVAVVFSGLRVPEHCLGDPDIWWHLADARILTQTHHFIHADPYSFTVAGQRWVNPEWLSELPYWFGYESLGPVGVYLATLIILGANIFFLYWRAYHKARHAGVALYMAALGFVLMLVNANARTILVAYLALTCELAILEAVERGKGRLLWLLPPLFCVWINLHGSWIIGLGLLVLYVACGLIRIKAGMIEQEAFALSDRNRLLLVLGACVAVLMINPYGWRLIWNPIDMAMNQTLNIANVQEWQPLSLDWFVGKAAFAAIALMVISNAVHGRKWKVYELAWMFFAWYAAFDHARFTFLAAVVTIPMIAGDLARSFFPTSNEKTIPAMNALMAAGVLCVIAWYFPSQAKMAKGMAREWPLESIASIEPSWRTLNEEHLGGLMDFDGKPTFIDTRWDIFEHHGVMSDFLDILHSHDSLRLLDKYGIDHVLLRQDEPLSYLLEHTQGWKIVRQEGEGHDQYTLFARASWVAGAANTPAAH